MCNCYICRTLIAAVVCHIANVYESSTSNNEEDYCARQDGEIISQVYPLFPILIECAVYKPDCRIQDEKQLRDSCQKDFPSHSKLTPGLYLLTCGCQQKSVYGFSMMMSGESPAMLFDLIMTRFENDYIFCWLDWDGDNILIKDGGVIDFGSVRQFGLYHHAYRFDDDERWSTNIKEQKKKVYY